MPETATAVKRILQYPEKSGRHWCFTLVICLSESYLVAIHSAGDVQRMRVVRLLVGAAFS